MAIRNIYISIVLLVVKILLVYVTSGYPTEDAKTHIENPSVDNDQKTPDSTDAQPTHSAQSATRICEKLFTQAQKLSVSPVTKPNSDKKPGRPVAKDEIEDMVKKIISEKLYVDITRVIRKARLIEDLGADCLDISEVITEIEKQFDMEIPDHVAETLVTVGNYINYVRKIVECQWPVCEK